jgi:hypothetical protein
MRLWGSCLRTDPIPHRIVHGSISSNLMSSSREEVGAAASGCEDQHMLASAMSLSRPAVAHQNQRQFAQLPHNSDRSAFGPDCHAWFALISFLNRGLTPGLNSKVDRANPRRLLRQSERDRRKVQTDVSEIEQRDILRRCRTDRQLGASQPPRGLP